MYSSLKDEIVKRKWTSVLQIFLLIPYTYILYQISLYFLTIHGWPFYAIFLALAWIILMQIRFLFKDVRKSIRSGYTDLSQKAMVLYRFDGTHDAYEFLQTIWDRVCTRAGVVQPVVFLVYDADGKDKNKQKNVMVMMDGGLVYLFISRKTLEYHNIDELSGVLAHELAHLLIKGIGIQRLIRILQIPANCLSLFICVAIGFVNWWLFLPALLVGGLIHQFIAYLPVRTEEDSADHFACSLGYGEGLKSWLEDTVSDFPAWDGSHGSHRGRIKLIKKALDK